jgi:hypothetical protein
MSCRSVAGAGTYSIVRALQPRGRARGRALGALLAGVPDWVAAHSEISALSAMRVMFMVCALSGLAILILYLYMPSHQPATTNVPAALAGACLGDRNE